MNPNDYDSVMGFLCSACEDEANDPACPVCGYPRSEHQDETLCRNVNEDDEAEYLIRAREIENELGRPY